MLSKVRIGANVRNPYLTQHILYAKKSTKSLPYSENLRHFRTFFAFYIRRDHERARRDHERQKRNKDANMSAQNASCALMVASLALMFASLSRTYIEGTP